jgi:hypothetical protein
MPVVHDCVGYGGVGPVAVKLTVSRPPGKQVHFGGLIMRWQTIVVVDSEQWPPSTPVIAVTVKPGGGTHLNVVGIVLHVFCTTSW